MRADESIKIESEPLPRNVFVLAGPSSTDDFHFEHPGRCRLFMYLKRHTISGVGTLYGYRIEVFTPFEIAASNERDDVR